MLMQGCLLRLACISAHEGYGVLGTGAAGLPEAGQYCR